MSAVLVGDRRGRLALLLALVVVLVAAGSGSARASFGTAVVVTGANLGEPGIDVARDGTLSNTELRFAKQP
jgi:TRAP-type C4-dicarboxylate transport system permease large subunit